MKDYKARGSNLQFRERKGGSRRVITFLVGAAALAAIAYLGSRWLLGSGEPASETTLPTAADRAGDGTRNAIPLTLPPPPASYNTASPTTATDTDN